MFWGDIAVVDPKFHVGCFPSGLEVANSVLSLNADGIKDHLFHSLTGVLGDLYTPNYATALKGFKYYPLPNLFSKKDPLHYFMHSKKVSQILNLTYLWYCVRLTIP